MISSAFTGRVIRCTTPVLLLLTLGACSLLPSQRELKAKFSATTRENVTVFSEQTMSMLTDADLVFDANQAVYTRDYFTPDVPEVAKFRACRDEVKRSFFGIVKYSLELVRIAGNIPDERAKVNAYADYLASINADGRYKLSYSEETFNALIAEIRRQETFRDALIKAQPVINAAGDYIGKTLNDLSDATTSLAAVTESRIDKRYELVIKYQAALEREKQEILVAVSYLYKAMKGEEDAYKQLLDTKAILDPRLIPKGAPRFEDLKKIGEHLSWRMEALHKVDGEIAPDWEVYRATHRELDQLADQANKKTARAKAVAMLWTRAHQKMAIGQSAPAEWIDYKDLPQLIGKFLL